MFRLTASIASALLLVSLAGCSKKVADDDPKASLARQIVLDMITEDHLNVGGGDRVDWKFVTPMDDGEVTLSLTVGNPFEGPHGLTGEAVVYTDRADQVAKAVIRPTKNKYELTFDGEANSRYMVKVEGASGKAAYKFAYAQTVAVADPCAGVVCGSSQECRGGTCVDLEEDPPEDPPDPPTSACPDGCKKGFYCSKSRRKCLKRAKRPARPVKKGCTPKCKKGFTCKGTKCKKVPGDTKKPVTAGGKTGPIGATVIQVTGGAKAIILINRGTKHNVKVGDRGKIAGKSFKIIKAFPFRAKAKVNAPAAAISSVKRCVVNRK